MKFRTVTLSVERNERGEFLFQGALGPGEELDPEQLRQLLFAWHRRSAYGTFAEERWINKRPYLALSPADALDWLSEPVPSRNLPLQWEEGTERYRRAAKLLRAALHEGRFAPVPPRHARGKPAWTLLPPDPPAHAEAAASPDRAAAAADRARSAADTAGAEVAAGAEDAAFAALLDDWLNAALRQCMAEPGAPRDAWRSLVAAHPGAAALDGSGAGEGAPAVPSDEEVWLEHIGYFHDSAPFRIGLRLVEALTEEAGWTLQPMLIDRADARRMYPCTPEGCPAGGDDGEAPPRDWLADLPASLERQTARLRRIWPDFAWELDDEQAWMFLEEIGPRLKERGIAVFLPRWWEELGVRKPRLLTRLRPDSAGDPLFGLDQLIRFDWRIAIGDAELDEATFRRLVESNRRLVRIGEAWIPLHPRWVQAFSAVLKRYGKRDGLRLSEVLELHLLQGVEELVEIGPSEDADGAADVPVTAVPVQIEVRLNERMRQLVSQLTESASRAAVPPPGQLAGVLRPYQTEGMSWLLFLRRCGFGACLADDMGLGKTLQFIAYLLTLKEKGELTSPALIICPTSVLGNWQKELQRFAPELAVYIHYGQSRKRGEAFADAAGGCDLVVTSYALGQLDYDELSGIHWSAIGLDEAQNIKNPHGKQSQAIRRLSGAHRIALTGTPIENRLAELWTLFDFINPGYLGSLTRFQQRYARPIERDNDEEKAGRLRRLIAPFLLRRTKKDPSIRLDLPDKHESKTWVSLTAEQAALYEQVIADMLARIDRLPPMERRGLILRSLTKLKQICDHPALYLKETESAGRKASARSGGDQSEPRTLRRLIARSVKLQRLIEMVDEVRQEEERCLIFTQFVGMGEMLVRALSETFGEPVQFLHGGVPKEERDRMVARFQDMALPAGEGCGIFVLSLKAGGTGLNLTAASHVFHFDRWWNPAVEDQATDRAYRIGQRKDVQVHKFVTLGTLEERIDDMIARKQELRRQFAGSGENWITELSTEELQDLFALRRNWIEA